MKYFEYGAPNPLVSATGGFWIQVKDGRARIGGYSQDMAWSGWDPSDEWAAGSAKWEMPTAKAIKEILLLNQTLERLEAEKAENKQLREENKQLKSQVSSVATRNVIRYPITSRRQLRAVMRKIEKV